jgi:mannose-6-phosphate isomerase class I
LPLERIEPSLVERAWGSETWYPAGDLLIKYIRTRQRLSVQVHPGDDYARAHENSRGKTEMWYIAAAAPGAEIALGFRERYPVAEVRAAALSGEIVEMLQWWPAREGGVFFTPAGAVHAIGGGIELWEIQQNSDVTYRLYDYGRGRPLHLDKALDVADLGPHPGPTSLPVVCPWFMVSTGEGEADSGIVIALESGDVLRATGASEIVPGRFLQVK